MTVEIKELVIRAVIKPENDHNQETRQRSLVNIDEQAIVDACVKQVLKVLRRKQER